MHNLSARVEIVLAIGEVVKDHFCDAPINRSSGKNRSAGTAIQI
jgi:hypothetical protein